MKTKNIKTTWDSFLKEIKDQEYYKELKKFLDKEYLSNTTYPKKDDIFKAFKLCPIDKLKVIILGQDPYHRKGQANGLAFSVNKGIKIPPSLRNIYKELNSDLGIKIPEHGDLTFWAKQGILLLNTTLTVTEGKPLSHKGKGWEIFTDLVIKKINIEFKDKVFLLWGANARSKVKFIDQNKHLILEAPHPSPLSVYRGFDGCNHFSKLNLYLKEKSIDWNLT